MRCHVLKQFNRRGEPQLPGSIIEVPEDMIPKLAGYVQAIASADSYSPALPPVPKGRGIWKLADFCRDTIEATVITPSGIPARPSHACRYNTHTDLWLTSCPDYPVWRCRKCHPPAPGAERKPSNTPVITAIGE
jgi:hypothetical protein